VVCYNDNPRLLFDKIKHLYAVQKVNEERREIEKARKLVLSWLSSLTFEAKQQHLRENYQPGIGRLIESEEFRKWRFVPKGSTLWCSGIPGAGMSRFSVYSKGLAFVEGCLYHFRWIAKAPL